jgi:hypothetical protein
MNRNNLIANGVLWAAAIIASTAIGAPVVLSVIFLPALAAVSLLIIAPRHCVTAATEK